MDVACGPCLETEHTCKLFAQLVTSLFRNSSSSCAYIIDIFIYMQAIYSFHKVLVSGFSCSGINGQLALM